MITERPMDVLTTQLKAELICFPDFVVFDSPLTVFQISLGLMPWALCFFFFLYAQCHNSVAPLFYSIPVSQKRKKKWASQKIPLLLDYHLNNNHIRQQYGLPHYLTRKSYTSYVLSPGNCELVGFTPINGVNRPMGYQLIV